MFTYIRLNNVGGINSEIELDLKSPPRKKDKKNSVKAINTTTYIDKVIGIIGANASGKSSILDALSSVRFFIGRQKILNISKSKDLDLEIENTSNYTFLPIKNIEKIDDESTIEFEVFIPVGQKPGLYKYTLQYTDSIVREKLCYKKTFSSQKVFVIEDYESESMQSDIGYKCFYKDSILQDYKNVNAQLVKSFLNTMDYYESFYYYIMSSHFSYYDDSLADVFDYDILTSFVENNIEIVSKFINLVDPKIVDVIVEYDKEDDCKEMRFKTKNGSYLFYRLLSTGTKKMLNFFARIYDKIQDNGIYICDEIETSLHRELIHFIIDLFLNSDKYCQLIFTTLNPEILDGIDIRNDQKFYISNKDGIVVIDKISSINSRSDYSLSKNYYNDDRFMPQPSSTKITKFCNKYICSK